MNAIARFQQAVEEQVRLGMRTQAIRHVAAADPDLCEQFMREYNEASPEVRRAHSEWRNNLFGRKNDRKAQP